MKKASHPTGVIEISDVGRYKKDLCTSYLNMNGYCIHDYKCRFAHGVIELRGENEYIETYLAEHLQRNPLIQGLKIDLSTDQAVANLIYKPKQYTRADFTTKNLHVPGYEKKDDSVENEIEELLRVAREKVRLQQREQQPEQPPEIIQVRQKPPIAASAA